MSEKMKSYSWSTTFPVSSEFTDFDITFRSDVEKVLLEADLDHTKCDVFLDITESGASLTIQSYDNELYDRVKENLNHLFNSF